MGNQAKMSLSDFQTSRLTLGNQAKMSLSDFPNTQPDLGNRAKMSLGVFRTSRLTWEKLWPGAKMTLKYEGVPTKTL